MNVILSFYKRIGFPLAYALLWAIGLFFTLWGTTFYDLSSLPTAAQNLYAVALVYVLFLAEVGLGFLNIGYNYANKKFSAKGFKSFGKVILNIVVTVMAGAFYMKTERVCWLYVLILMSTFLKYISVYMSHNIDMYFAINERKKVFVSNSING